MNYTEVKIYTSAACLEEVSNILHSSNVSGFIIEDEEDFKEFLENNKQYWDYVDDELLKEKHKETCIKLYISDDVDGKEQLSCIYKSINELKQMDIENSYGRLEIELAKVDEEDWASTWKQYYKPFTIGKSLVICPLWEDYNANEGEVVLKLDPGMAFGTGTHESTKLCLEMAQEYVKKEDNILDLGCGSGILSIAAMLLGAKKAVAIDIDSIAVKIALENAVLNGIREENYSVLQGNIIEDALLQKNIGENQYDVVFANIVADVIIALAPLMKKQLKEGGILITSGIIDIRKDDVSKVLLEQNFNVVEQKEEKGWVCFVCQK